MKVFSILLVVLFVVFARSGACAQDSLAFFPDRRIVSDLPADGSAHRFAASRVFDDGEAEVKVGGVVPVLEALLMNKLVQGSIGASIQARLDPGTSIAVRSVEFTVDFLLVDVQWSSGLMTRFGIGHASHHLGDEPPDSTGTSAIDYSRDYVSAFILGAIPRLGGLVYAGANYAYGYVVRRPIQKPLVLQAGFLASLPLLDPLAVYCAGDIKVRQELSYGTTQRYEAGWRYGKGPRSVRLGIWHTAGFDERGQLFGKARNEWGVGIFLNI